jgi:hypothetical protein
MLSIVTRIFVREILVRKLHVNNLITRIVLSGNIQFENPPDVINWEHIYPFEQISVTEKKESFPLGLNILPRFNEYKTGFEKYTKSYLINYTNFVELAVGYEQLIDWSLYYDTFDLGEGYLSSTIKKLSDGSQFEKLSDAVYEFNEFLADLSIDFLYVQCPYKITTNDSISGIFDFSNQNVDDLLKYFFQKNIPYIDIREYIKNEKLDNHSLFYKTDHHWKAETGLWATKIIADYINKYNDFSINISMFDPIHYQYDVYKDWFLGSIGRRVTLKRVHPEDFTFIYPKFDTDFVFKMPSRNIDRPGSFTILYDSKQIEKKDYYGYGAYAGYCYGGGPLISIHNNNLNDGKKVLIIKDSFGEVIAPFFAIGIETLEILDLRVFDGSIKTYIKQTKPDLVLVIYNPGSILISDYMVHTNTFDFR